MPIDVEAGARLIDLAGAPAFGTQLLDMAASHAGIEEIFGYIVDDAGARPLVLASTLDHQNLRVEAYARRFFRQDPAISPTAGHAIDANFAQTVMADEIIPRDYRKICFDAPRFAGKLCFGWRSAAHTLVLNFYRRDGAPDAAQTELAAIADLALAALQRRLQASGDEQSFLDTLETRLLTGFPLLAARERQVIARTLGGHTADDIATALGMGRGTVLTYRQRAYQKYGFSNAGAFLPHLI